MRISDGSSDVCSSDLCINRALVMGGRAAIRVPYREGLLNYSPHRGYGHQFGHLRSFNEDILKIYLEQVGFRIVASHLDGYSPYMPRDWVMKSTVGRLLIMEIGRASCGEGRGESV